MAEKKDLHVIPEFQMWYIAIIQETREYPTTAVRAVRRAVDIIFHFSSELSRTLKVQGVL